MMLRISISISKNAEIFIHVFITIVVSIVIIKEIKVILVLNPQKLDHKL